MKGDQQMPCDYISMATAAQLCSVSLPTFRGWVEHGLIFSTTPALDLERNLVRRDDVEGFLVRMGEYLEHPPAQRVLRSGDC